MRALLIFLFSFLIFSCSVIRKKEIPWIEYSSQYVASEEELTKFVMNISNKNIEYRVITHKEGTIEIQYRTLK